MSVLECVCWPREKWIVCAGRKNEMKYADSKIADRRVC